MGAGQDCGAGRLGIEDGASTQHDFISQSVRDLLQYRQSPRHSEGDFDRLDAAGEECFGHVGQNLAVRRTKNRDNTGIENAIENVGGGHGWNVNCWMK